MDPLKELEGLDAGHQLALIKKLGGREVVDALLRGEKTAVIKDAVRKLFDRRGRRIPQDLKAKTCDINPSFQLIKPGMDKEADFAGRIRRLHKYLSVDVSITVGYFRAEAERLLGIIRDNPLVANVAKGVCLPVIIPKLANDDLGAELEFYLTGAAFSHVETFISSEGRFYNNCRGKLNGRVGIVDRSRYGQLIQKIKTGPVVALHFPNPLQGFSLEASREQMATLPEGFILSGMDTPIAMIMYPDVLARDCRTPVLFMAALYWQNVFNSLYFRTVNGNTLVLERMSYLDKALCTCSSSLLFIG